MIIKTAINDFNVDGELVKQAQHQLVKQGVSILEVNTHLCLILRIWGIYKKWGALYFKQKLKRE